MSASPPTAAERVAEGKRPAFAILLSICTCHLINDMLQSLLPAIYPLLKQSMHLTFAELGLITLAYQLTASLLQPVVGLAADKHPAPFSLPGGTLFTFAGLLVLSSAGNYRSLLVGACIVGVGSSVFHPESSRVARMASGGRPGLAQSLFQVGGNVGSALGPLGAALMVVRWGQRGVGYFAILALVSTAILLRVGFWYKRHGLALLAARPGRPAADSRGSLSRAQVTLSFLVLLVLIFSKFIYLASFTSYYIFYLMRRFDLPVGTAQVYLFALFAGVAAGTLSGGPLGDRFGRKHIIWFSILGVLPFSLALPHVGLFWTGVLSVVIGFVLASAFPSIVVYGQELLPGRVGVVAGLFFGLSFGAGGIGAAFLGQFADATSVEYVYQMCAFLPALGMFAALLPNLSERAPGPLAVARIGLPSKE